MIVSRRNVWVNTEDCHTRWNPVCSYFVCVDRWSCLLTWPHTLYNRMISWHLSRIHLSSSMLFLMTCFFIWLVFLRRLWTMWISSNRQWMCYPWLPIVPSSTWMRRWHNFIWMAIICLCVRLVFLLKELSIRIWWLLIWRFSCRVQPNYTNEMCIGMMIRIPVSMKYTVVLCNW